MVEIVQKSINYEIVSASKSAIQAEGRFSVVEGGKIKDLFLSFHEAEKSLGSVTYSEEEHSVDYRYSFADTLRKKELGEFTDSVIADVKSQISQK